MRYIGVLRFGIDEGYEYIFAHTRRENGIIHECEQMVLETLSNMTEHSGRNGAIITEEHPTDKRAVVLVAINDSGVRYYRTITYRENIK